MKRTLFFSACAVLSAAVLMADVPERHSSTMKDIRTQPVKRLAVMSQAEGEAYSVPYECSLGKGMTDGYTVVDANGDGRTWKPGGFTSYSVCMAPNDEAVDEADDWMITPAIALENGKSYLVTFDAAMTLSKTEDIIEVFAGLEATAEGMTERVSPVIKYPCNDKAFTTYSYTFSPAETGNYYIGFHCMSRRTDSGTPKLANLKIEVAATPVEVPENAQEIPFESPLGSKDPLMDLYTMIDADGDGRSWNPKLSSGVSCMKPNTDDVQRNDDWLITMPLHLFAGKTYTFSALESSALSGTIGETSAMYIGTAPTVEAMTTVLVPTHDITVRDTPVEANFTVDADGYYYIGIHCTSDKATSGIYKVSNLSVKEYSEKVEPAAAGTLTYEIAPKGELKATLTYTAPTVDVTGAPLEYLTKVVITTNWAYKTEITDVVPGGTYTVETTDLWDGNQNRFEAVAYIGDVAGESLLITGVFAGEDTPLDPTNLKIALSDDYTKVTLSWDPVGEVGEHGGWVNVDDLQYFIFDAFGSYYDPAIGSTTGTSFTIDFGDIEGQDFAAYQVTACVGEYNASMGVTSDIVVVGKPDALPFFESFADCHYHQMWVVDPESNGQVMEGLFYDDELRTNYDDDDNPTYLNSQDSDNGFYLMIPYEKDASYGFYSAKIDISSAANPAFQLFYQGKGSVLELKVGADGAVPEVVKAIDLKENSTDDWTLASIDLTPYKSAKYVQVGLMIRGVHNTDTETWSVPIDNIRVIDLMPKNVRIVNTNAPAKVEAGEIANVSVVLENIGTETLENVEVELNAVNVTSALLIPSMAAYTTIKAVFDVPTSVLSDDEIAYVFNARADGETDLEDNTAAGKFTVVFPALPAPADLTVTPDGNSLQLSWTAPQFEDLKAPKAIVEDFENPAYESFTITDFGDWTMVDNDGKKTYTFLGDALNPYRTAPMAFQLYEPKASGMPEDYLVDVDPASGDRLLVAWSAQGLNDNWLISPKLPGLEQTISFKAKSFTIAYAESFEVLYSTTDKSLSSFVSVTTVDYVPEIWTEYNVTVPAGAKYFAIRHNAYDTYALFIDDIAFEAAGEVAADLEILGYKPYIDGICAADLCPETSFVKEFNSSGKHSARVTAVYNHGESRACEPVEAEIIITGVEDVTTEAVISLTGNVLTVKAAADTTVTVTDALGRYIVKAATDNNGNFSTTLPAGLVIVKAGAATAKYVIY